MAGQYGRQYTSPTTNIYALNVARYAWAFMFTMFNMETFFHVGLALTSTYVTSSAALNIRYKLDSFFISLAIISPLMYSLRAAFYRRETAAKSMAALKAACLAYYLTMRDWNRVPKGSMQYVGDNNSPMAKEVYAVVHKFLRCVVRYIRYGMGSHQSLAEVHISHMSPRSWFLTLFQSKVDFDAIQKYPTDEEKGALKERLLQEDLNNCYEALSELNMWNERALVSWGNEKPGEGAISSRSNSHIRYIVFAFEELRLAREYRTPVMLLYGVRILIVIYAIFMGPYFNSTCDSFEMFELHKLMKGKFGVQHNIETITLQLPSCYVNYIGTTLFFVSVALLARAAKDVEFPFDKKGLDDLFFDSDQEMESFVKLPGDEEFKKRVMAVVVEPTLARGKKPEADGQKKADADATGLDEKNKENKNEEAVAEHGNERVAAGGVDQVKRCEASTTNGVQPAAQKMDHGIIITSNGVLPTAHKMGHDVMTSNGVLPSDQMKMGHDVMTSNGVLPTAQRMDHEINTSISVLPTTQRMDREINTSNGVLPTAQRMDREINTSNGVLPTAQRMEREINTSNGVLPTVQEMGLDAIASNGLVPAGHTMRHETITTANGSVLSVYRPSRMQHEPISRFRIGAPPRDQRTNHETIIKQAAPPTFTIPLSALTSNGEGVWSYRSYRSV